MALHLCIGISYILVLLVCSSVGGPAFDNVGSPAAPAEVETPPSGIDGMMDIPVENTDIDEGEGETPPSGMNGMLDIMWENRDIDGEGNNIAEEHGHLIEGDIFEEDEDPSRRKKRNALRNRESLWHGGAVPYVIDGYFNINHKKHILGAMQRFHEKTCIRFVPRTIERDYIFFTQNLGCWSMVGRTGGRQKISLSGTCRSSRGVIMHELMHAIGFRHEHNRPDRDGYISVYWQNIKEGFTTNFRKYSNDQVQTLGTGYDFLSLMHYPLTAFSKDGNTVTIGPRYPTYQIADVGNRDDFSHIDSYRINALYKCGQCEDTDKYYCPIWAMMGECSANKEWMTKYCPFSCDRCTIALAHGNGLACIDQTSNCKRWAKIGECERNPAYMLQNCRRSCKQCRAVDTETGEEDGLACQDDNTLCYDWATLGECSSNAKFMKRHCRRSCHVCTGGDGRIITDTGECRDRNPQCPTWAKTTRCQVNQGYMQENCQLSCNWCPPEETCKDIDPGCEKWARGGHCLTNEEGLRTKCQKSCGHCGEVEECRDVHRKCREWTKANWCTRGKLFMRRFCAPACGLCDDNRPGNNQTAVQPETTKSVKTKKAKQTKQSRQQQEQEQEQQTRQLQHQQQREQEREQQREQQTQQRDQEREQQREQERQETANNFAELTLAEVQAMLANPEDSGLTAKEIKALKRVRKHLKQEQQRQEKQLKALQKAAAQNNNRGGGTGTNPIEPIREGLDEAAITG